MGKDIFLSICVPSYNRGEIALRLIEELHNIIQQFDSQIEIVLSNNGSEKFREEYNIIEGMSGTWLKYHRFSSNQGFVRNFNQVIRLSQGKFCLLLSDEDHVDTTGLRNYISYLKSNPDIGMVRSATTRMYSYQTEDCYYESGMEAINGYFLQGNYLSGIIYNRGILTNSLIDEFENRFINNEAYIAYPHMLIEAYLCTVVDVLRGKTVLVIEGEDQKDQEQLSDYMILPYSSIESRISQAKGYIEYIGLMECSNGLKLKMISEVISKTFYLITLVKDKYEKKGISIVKVLDDLSCGLKIIIKNSHILVVNMTEELLVEYIDACKDAEIRNFK